MSPGRIILYIAASVDGFIADDAGSVEWLDEFQQETATGDDDSGYEDFFTGIDCLVMGAATYEQVLTFGEWPYEDRPTYVFTHRELPRATDAVEFVEGPVDTVAIDLKGQYEHIWLVGGATLAQEFLREHQVDGLRLSLVPVLLGSGISLFSSTGERQRLLLRDAITRDSGIVELQYKVHP